MDELEARINYEFNNKELLVQALTHSSFGYENGCQYNERLEFLGDSILGYIVSRDLYTYFAGDQEGTLSKLKSVLVSSQTLAAKARELGLGANLRLGKGERKAAGHNKSSILADAMESLIGAIHEDGGLDACDRFIQHIYRDDIKNASLAIKNAVDFKTLLQERLQEVALGLPTYKVDSEEGPAHNRRFLVRVEVKDYKGPIGVGTSKKNAQQECARLLLEDAKFWKTYASAATGK